jgi:hypothetical protein
MSEANHARDDLPPGLECYSQEDIFTALGFRSEHILGIRGGALLFHLFQRFPKAAWFIEGDDDTFFGRCLRHQRSASIVAQLHQSFWLTGS